MVFTDWNYIRSCHIISSHVSHEWLSGELVNRIMGINGHLIVYKKNEPLISNYNEIVSQIMDIKNVVAVTPHLEGQALAKTKNGVTGVVIRGTNWSDLAPKKLLWDSLDEDNFKNFKNKKNIIVGYRLGQRLNVKVGDFISLISPNGTQTALGTLPLSQNFVVGGFFNIGMYEYDNNFIFIPWDKAESFLSVRGMAHGIEIFLNDQNLTSSVYLDLKNKLDSDLIIIDWKKNSSFMNALAVEKNVMFIILTLIILVAAFNIISSMIMLVQTKKSDIALMRTMGASKYLIMRIFLLTGSIIGFLGTFVGSILGLVFASNIQEIRVFITNLIGEELFSPEIYFLSKLPSKINFDEVLSVIIISIILTLLASLFPAWKASKISPAEALRYE